MTLDELAASLPNGLHDGELATVKIDFTSRKAQLELDVWIGDEVEIEAYRRAEITLSGLHFWVAEPPDPAYRFNKPAAVRIDIGSLTNSIPERRPALPLVPRDVFVSWLYVSDWNAFIYIAAEAAELKWLGDRVVR